MTLLSVSACSNMELASTRAKRGGPDLNNAQAACMERGYDYGSYEYNVCYENRPEVQEAQRTRRLDDLTIINRNRPSNYNGRSYPVE